MDIDQAQVVFDHPADFTDADRYRAAQALFAELEQLRKENAELRERAERAPDVAALLQRLDEIEQRIERYEWSAAGTLAPTAKIRVVEVRALLSGQRRTAGH